MSHLVRITALVAVFAAAGCVGNAEVAQTKTVAATQAVVATEATSQYSAMHAAIPASRTNGNVFEYN